MATILVTSNDGQVVVDVSHLDVDGTPEDVDPYWRADCRCCPWASDRHEDPRLRAYHHGAGDVLEDAVAHLASHHGED